MKERGYEKLLHRYRKQIEYVFKIFLICSLPGILILLSYSREVSGQEIEQAIKNSLKITDETEVNESMINKINQINNYTAGSSETYDFLNVSYKAGYLREIEEFYSLNSFYQNLKITKRFSDKFQLTLSPAIEYSEKKQTDSPNLYKWYDNTGLRAVIDFNAYNTLSVFAAGSISDSTWTAYGTSLSSVIESDEFQISNYFIATYEYFYYWNQVAQNFVNDNVKLKYNNFTISAGYFYGVVENNYVDGFETKAKNPNSSFSFDAGYKISTKPAVSVGFQFSTRDFEYYSPLYYSPQDRKLTGINASFFNMFTNYYIYFGGGAKVDNNDNFIWAVDLEGGYENGNFSISAGLSRYNDPFYSNYNTFLNIVKSF